MKNRFTPLESPTASSGDGDVIPFGANTGFRAPCEPSRRKAADLLTGFTGIIAVFLLVTLLSPASSAVSGEIYKWKDKDGNIVFSDTPPPPGVNAEKKEFKEESTERPKTKEYFSKPISERVEEKRPYRDIHVIMYMTS